MISTLFCIGLASAFIFEDFMKEEPPPILKAYTARNDRDPVILLPGFLFDNFSHIFLFRPHWQSSAV